MSKKILVILGQPQRHSYGGALAKAYADGGARRARKSKSCISAISSSIRFQRRR